MKTYVRKGTEELAENQVLMWVMLDSNRWFQVDEKGRGRLIMGFYGGVASDTWEPSLSSFDVYEYP